MPDQDLSYIISANVESYKKGMAEVLKELKNVTGAFLGFGTAAQALKYIVTEATQAEKATALLKTALQNAKGGSQAMLETMDKYAASMSKASGFTDEAVKGGLTNLVNVTGDANLAMKGLAPAIDLAIAKHMSLESAAQLVGRAMTTGTTILRRYGIVTAENLKGTAALDAITKKFHGTTEAYMNTLEGKEKAAKASMDELAKTLGMTLLPVLKSLIDDYLRPAVDWWQHLAEKMHLVNISAREMAINDAIKQTEKDLTQAREAMEKFGQSGYARVSQLEKKLLGLRNELAQVKNAADDAWAAGPKTSVVDDTTRINAEKKAKIEAEEMKKGAEEKAKIEAEEMKKGAEEKARIEKQEGEKRLSVTKNILSQTSALMASHNRKEFEIGKAASIALATINTAEGAIDAYKAMAGIPGVGPALGAAAAAVIAGFGAAQISTISATQFNPKGAATGIWDWRAAGNNETLVTTISQGESILSREQTQALAQGQGGGDHYNITIKTDGLTDTRQIDKVIREVITPGLKRHAVYTGATPVF